MVPLFDQFIKRLPSGGRVLDVGAGKGVEASHLASLGFRVDAVDRQDFGVSDTRVNWHAKTIESFMSEQANASVYDGILLKNIIQMLDKEWVLNTAFPQLISLLRSNGVMAIETFWKEPELRFRKEMRLYTVEELRDALSGCEILLSEQTTERKNDLEGEPHTFGITRMLLRSPERE